MVSRPLPLCRKRTLGGISFDSSPECNSFSTATDYRQRAQPHRGAARELTTEPLYRRILERRAHPEEVRLRDAPTRCAYEVCLRGVPARRTIENLLERIQSGDIGAEDQRVDVVRAFVGVDRFEVHMWRMIGYSSVMPFAPRMSRAMRANSSAIRTLLRLASEICCGLHLPPSLSRPRRRRGAAPW